MLRSKALSGKCVRTLLWSAYEGQFIKLKLKALSEICTGPIIQSGH